jgi:hypothetical protein
VSKPVAWKTSLHQAVVIAIARISRLLRAQGVHLASDRS